MAKQAKPSPSNVACVVMGILTEVLALVLVASEKINVRSALTLMFFGAMVGFVPTMVSKMKVPK
ncbi:MAG TPA: hypothetical protein VK475_07075 [Pyrinomonadaceae bacterium]|nr:hypothetical protein [Pyrinomonadaceae bacterium]